MTTSLNQDPVPPFDMLSRYIARGGASERPDLRDPRRYVANPQIRTALGAALELGQPLLLSGEPGTGKTCFAYYAAHLLHGELGDEFGLEEPLVFNARSTSQASDLFYTYDALARLRDAQAQEPEATSARQYIHLQAMGKAIMLGRGKPLTQDDPALDLGENPLPADGPWRSVVLVDDIDSAPRREFALDLLSELELTYFHIPEMDSERYYADRDHLPVTVITCASALDLPESFVRRCLYHNIDFPDQDQLHEIVVRRMAEPQLDGRLLESALEFFYMLRGRADIRKKPSTAELLGWLLVIRDIVGDASSADKSDSLLNATMSALIKTERDRIGAHPAVAAWVNDHKGKLG